MDPGEINGEQESNLGSAAPTWSWPSILLNRYYAISYTYVMTSDFLQHPNFSVLDVRCSAFGGVLSRRFLHRLQALFNTLQRGQKSPHFTLDRRSRIYFQETLYCLFIGEELIPKVSGDATEYALVLQSLILKSQPQHYYQGVGLLKVAASKNWSSNASLGKVLI